MAMGLETDRAIRNQMKINKLGLKEITPHTNACYFVHATWVSIAGYNERQYESWNIFDILMLLKVLESPAEWPGHG